MSYLKTMKLKRQVVNIPARDMVAGRFSSPYGLTAALSEELDFGDVDIVAVAGLSGSGSGRSGW